MEDSKQAGSTQSGFHPNPRCSSSIDEPRKRDLLQVEEITEIGDVDDVLSDISVDFQRSGFEVRKLSKRRFSSILFEKADFKAVRKHARDPRQCRSAPAHVRDGLMEREMFQSLPLPDMSKPGGGSGSPTTSPTSTRDLLRGALKQSKKIAASPYASGDGCLEPLSSKEAVVLPESFSAEAGGPSTADGDTSRANPSMEPAENVVIPSCADAETAPAGELD